MKKTILIIITAFCIYGCTENDQTENLLAQVDSLKIENDSLAKRLTEEKPESNYWYDANYDGEKLIESGISNPAEFIVSTFREKTELIPLKAVLGGTMYFRNIQLLSSEWLIADFEDGHVQGKAIYRYKLNKNGQLEFELLDSIGPE